MCGIVGSIGLASLGEVRQMNDFQKHRGPDSFGIFHDQAANVILAMRRLAIIDVAGGDQPMISADDRYAIVFNGEIFNAPELKKKLEQQGEIFLSDHSDTEVLFKLLIREGETALPKLNGMFVFAFYDKKKQTLMVARDRFGIKPLYYLFQNGGLAFASELKSLKSLSGFDHAISETALYHYLSLQYVIGSQSIYQHVQKLDAAHVLEYDLQKRTTKISRWWKPEFCPDHSVKKEEWPERVRVGLEQAVVRWSQSDVPIAISLSGGLDSSAIAGICATNNIEVSAYSLGFQGENEAQWDELPLARKVAEKWGMDFHETILKPEALLGALEPMVASLDEPYGGGLPSWFVYAAMAGNVSVAHTGSGGDEMFGNYGKWSGLEGGRFSFGWYKKLDRISRKRFKEHFFDRYYYFKDAEKTDLLINLDGDSVNTIEELYERFISSGGATARDAVAMSDSQTQLCDEFLQMTDRFSMQHSIEARTPFLDNEFSDMVRTIPSEIRTNRNDLKGLLREAVTPYLLQELMSAPKRGFVIPLGLWMRTKLRPVVEELLGRPFLQSQGLINPDYYERYVVPHMQEKADFTHKLWAMLMFQLWYQQRQQN